jgi:hypothetical protein
MRLLNTARVLQIIRDGQANTFAQLFELFLAEWMKVSRVHEDRDRLSIMAHRSHLHHELKFLLENLASAGLINLNPAHLGLPRTLRTPY